MLVPRKIKDLVNQFEIDIEDYKKGTIGETEIRVRYINPMFEELGWQTRDRKTEKSSSLEVIHEYSQIIEGRCKKPDYAFKIGHELKFFLEAKKPSVNIKESKDSAYQARRYGFNAGIPVILTDFEEFSVYDIHEPQPNDDASVARRHYFTFKDYLEQWEEISGLFSRESVECGSLNQFAHQGGRKGSEGIDIKFLKDIEQWRSSLANNIALRNQKISERNLNTVVQKTLDRILFLRICEDRGIEDEGSLKNLLKKKNIYKCLCKIYLDAEIKYNSSLFYFTKEKDKPTESYPEPEHLLLQIDDQQLSNIISRLYFPESPYEFSVMPVEVLGQVYEQFLGKIIFLGEDHSVTVEEKPAVKKAGGIYYTPSYIVDYIVENTVGTILSKVKTIKKADKIKIVDPACGSGSFLLGAYQYLLDWYLKKYAEKKVKDEKVLYKGMYEDWHLTVAEKKRILLNNIYGVDIDAQAVEVYKLSLLLKALEGETKESIAHQRSLFRERALPDLSNNIKWGNSLIGTDFYAAQKIKLIDENEQHRVNAFDWDSGFKQIMKNGGFDVVIGNPPYVDIKSLPLSDVEYIFEEYPLSNNRINLFSAFIEKIFSLINAKYFRFSMIVPTALLTQDSYRALRRHVIENFKISKLVRLPNELFGEKVGDVKVDTGIFVFQEKNTNKEKPVEIIGYKGYERIFKIDAKSADVFIEAKQSIWGQSNDCIWSVNTSKSDQSILQKCELKSREFSEFAEFSLGLTPYDKYKGHTQEEIKGKVFHAEFKKDETYKKLLAGNDVLRYTINWNGTQWISYGPWLGAKREQRFFNEKRIVVKQIIDWTTKRIWACIANDELYNTQNAFNILTKGQLELEYLLGVFNSRLITYYHKKKYLDEFKMRFQKILIKDCKRIPIHAIDLSNPAEKSGHDKMVELVNTLLELNRQLQKTKTSQETIIIKRQVETVDVEIDNLVYAFYGLTKEEIAIVENN